MTYSTNTKNEFQKMLQKQILTTIYEVISITYCVFTANKLKVTL